MLVIFLSIAGIMGLFEVGVGTVGGVILLLAVGTGALIYTSFVFKGYQFLKDPNAQLAWFQKPLWNLVLRLARMGNWQGYDSSLKGRRIVKVRDRMFSDNDLMELKGFRTHKF